MSTTSSTESSAKNIGKTGSPRRRNVALGLVLLASIAGGVGFAYWRTDPTSTNPPPLPSLQGPITEVLPNAIEGTQGYLNRVLDSNGRFAYIQYVDGRAVDRKKYNILRHAGSVYALSMLQARGQLDDKTKTSVARAAQYLLRTNYDEVQGQGNNLAAIFSLPGEEVGRSNQREAKLGGTALGMIALLAARAIDPASVPLENVQALGRFVLFMQQDNGDFRAKFSESKLFEVDFESLFYPGEAILALVRLYQVDGDVTWLRAAAKAAAYLVDSRRGKTPPPDHWLLIASNELSDHLGKLENSPISADLLYEHVVSIADLMLDEQKTAGSRQALLGAFGSDNRSTPSSTRLEGLLALDQLAQRRGDTALQARLRPAIVQGGRFVASCVVKDGPYAGGVTAAAIKKPDTEQNKKFNDEQGEIRIDYVQHALSAFIGLEKLCASYACDK